MFKKKVGAGNFGEVYFGTWLGTEVAIKMVLSDVPDDSEQMKSFRDEISLMR